jgi:hypothetical protein
MSATVVPFPTFTQERHVESERNALLEADNRWLEQRLVEATIANDELVRHVVAAEARVEKAERWVRARMIQLAWPATLAGLAGGFLAVLALRWLT